MTRKTKEADPSFLHNNYLLKSLITDLESIGKKAGFMLELSAQDFLPSNHKLLVYEQKLKERNGIVLERRIMAASKYVSSEEVLADMNFQTILQPRINNFIAINTALLKELIEISVNTSSYYNSRFLKSFSILCRINFMQIEVFKNEYKDVIENLNKILNSLNDFLEIEFGFLDVYYFSNTSLFEVISETICKKLKNISEMICPDEMFNESSLKELDIIDQYSNAERKVFNQVVEMSRKGNSFKSIHHSIIKTR